MGNSEIRILSIIPYKIFPAKLGGEKGIAIFNEYLAKQVHLTAVTTQNNDPGYAKDYTLLNFLTNSKFRYVNIFLYFTIKKILKQERATHLLIEHPYFGWLGWLIRRTTNTTLIVHSHNIEYMRSKSIGRWWWKALMWYEAWVYRSADKIFFISEDDMHFAVNNLKADPLKSQPVTFGIEIEKLPEDELICRQIVRDRHSIPQENKILLFNGALYHSTNYDALKIILDDINPYFLSQPDFKYSIIVCGKGLPDFFNELKYYADKNVIYAGFVEDISVYFKTADVFINPILSGGGVKTKAIEALAMNCTVVSTELGAMGIKKEVCGRKLKIVYGNNWKEFADRTIESTGENDSTPSEFFNHYYWGNIIKTVVASLKKQNA